jgi:hypothetical protein
MPPPPPSLKLSPSYPQPPSSRFTSYRPTPAPNPHPNPHPNPPLPEQDSLVRDGAAYVLSTDDSVRSRAFQFLAQVIEGLAPATMLAAEGSVWLPFFVSKLSDEPAARHALRALAAVCASDCALSIESIGHLPVRVCDVIHVRRLYA